MAIPLVWVGLAAAGVYLLGNKSGSNPTKLPTPKHPILHPVSTNLPAPPIPPILRNGGLVPPPANLGQGSGGATTGYTGPQPFPVPPAAIAAAAAGVAAAGALPPSSGQGTPPVNPFGLGADAGPAAKLQPRASSTGIGVSGKLNVPTRVTWTNVKNGTANAASAAEINLFG